MLHLRNLPQMFKKIAKHKGNDKGSANFEHLHHYIQFQNFNVDNNFKVI